MSHRLKPLRVSVEIVCWYYPDEPVNRYTHYPNFGYGYVKGGSFFFFLNPSTFIMPAGMKKAQFNRLPTEKRRALKAEQLDPKTLQSTCKNRTRSAVKVGEGM
jgi:hypothetical protein